VGWKTREKKDAAWSGTVLQALARSSMGWSIGDPVDAACSTASACIAEIRLHST